MILHGAGTGTDAPLLASIAVAMGELGWDVIRIEQPYRLGETRRPPAPAAQLDEVVRTVVRDWGGSAPLVIAGRSSGARVGCRVAVSLGVSLVIAFGFPLVAPSGKSRQEELDEAGVPVLIFQGTRDEFGMPRVNVRKGREVIRVEGADHSLERPRAEVDPLEEIVAEVAERLRAIEV